MDLNLAIQKHAQWKFKFAAAVRSNEPLDVATISKDNCCEFGIWLYGDAKNQFQKLPAYVNCLSSHAEFHTAAGKVAAAINAKKTAEAEAMMAAGSPFSETSKKVSVAIIELKNAAKM
jgi:methyl-accepting chemotaxis protein